ncbi:MAG: isopentenyl-diphosphate Delta-isomerase [Sphingobacteriaceae bacterium]
MIEEVILVDADDNEIGMMEKMEAHRLGLLHRAFSVFVFNANGDLLLQQRALDKYHSGGLWTNTCCSHPRKGENLYAAAKRRLKEEMGMSCELDYGFMFTYHAAFADELSEHEVDHVFFGESDQLPQPDKKEVEAYQYVSLKALKTDVAAHPAIYTAWFKICLDKVLQHREIKPSP